MNLEEIKSELERISQVEDARSEVYRRLLLEAEQLLLEGKIAQAYFYTGTVGVGGSAMGDDFIGNSFIFPPKKDDDHE